MAINYLLDTSKVHIHIVPGDLVTMDANFLLSLPGGGYVVEVGEAICEAFQNIGDGQIQMVKVLKGFPRCFHCGAKNPYMEEKCLFCGESV